MNLSRLVHMTPAGFANRVRQEARKSFERLRFAGFGAGPAVEMDPKLLSRRLARGATTQPIRECLERDDLEGAAGLLLEQFRQTAPTRFFAGAADKHTPAAIAELLPDARRAVVQTALKAYVRRFDLLGYQNLDFGDPIAWHFDPISGIRAPALHWSRIDPLDRPTVGDHKVIWELNRHQWLVHMAQAYALTADETRAERYAVRVAETLDQWLTANPPGLGINWVSSLEIGFRLIAWCWALMIIRESAALNPRLYIRVLGAIHAQASHVERNLSYTYSPNTHLLGEALALFYVGVLFPELEGAETWRKTGWRILVDEIGRQILPDGVYFEQSTYYQRYTAEIYLHFLALAEQNGMHVPAAVSAATQKVLDFLLAVRRPDGSVPQIGDSDGGWLLPFVSRAADDTRGVFAIGAAQFKRSDFAWAAGGATVELAWLHGKRGIEALATTGAEPPARAASRLFADGGYAVLRSDWGPLAHQLVFDVGPLGCPFSSGHGHADLLAVNCDVFGEPCIADPGMPTYGGEEEWRNAFRSTAVHSTVLVDGQSQAIPDGTFSWKQRPTARLRSWISNSTFDFADGEHDAYRRLRDPVTHRRRIFFVKPRYWIVVDDLHGTTKHSIELRFQFAPLRAVLERSSWARVVTSGGRGLLIRATASVPLQAAIYEGEAAPQSICGWFSPAYGQRQPAPMLIYSAKAQLPIRLVTVLLPTERADAPIPDAFPPPGDESLQRDVLLGQLEEI